MSAGAYGYVMSSNYNVRPRVPEVMVKGKEFAVTKDRESYEELFKGEHIPQFLKWLKTIPFTKMAGAGNDFVVIDARRPQL